MLALVHWGYFALLVFAVLYWLFINSGDDSDQMLNKKRRNVLDSQPENADLRYFKARRAEHAAKCPACKAYYRSNDQAFCHQCGAQRAVYPLFTGDSIFEGMSEPYTTTPAPPPKKAESVDALARGLLKLYDDMK